MTHKHRKQNVTDKLSTTNVHERAAIAKGESTNLKTTVKCRAFLNLDTKGLAKSQLRETSKSSATTMVDSPLPSEAKRQQNS